MKTTLKLGCAGLVLFASGGGVSHAYVRTRASETNVELKWNKSCVNLRYLLGGRPTSVSEELFRTAVNEAAAQWSSSKLSCTKMFLSTSASTSTTSFVEADTVNTVQFRSDFWGRNARKEVDRVPYPQNALAITSVFANRKTGEIVDTDVEINAMFAMWGDVVANPQLLRSTNTHDLQNTLTHEFGHVIGLDHTCDGGGQSNLVDNEDKPVPACPGTAEIQETTMAAIVMPGDTLRRTLAKDDQDGVCQIYPADGNPACSTGESDGGCTWAPGRTPAAPAGLLAALAGFALVWRRRRPKR